MTEALEVLHKVARKIEEAEARYYYELDAICRDDSRKADLPAAKARHRAVSDLWDELKGEVNDLLGRADNDEVGQ